MPVKGSTVIQRLDADLVIVTAKAQAVSTNQLVSEDLAA